MKTTPTYPIVAAGLCCEKALPPLVCGIANTSGNIQEALEQAHVHKTDFHNCDDNLTI